jgi:hypothetical protein
MPAALGAIDEHRCIILLAAGYNAGAIASCQEALAILTSLAR